MKLRHIAFEDMVKECKETKIVKVGKAQTSDGSHKVLIIVPVIKEEKEDEPVDVFAFALSPEDSLSFANTIQSAAVSDKTGWVSYEEDTEKKE